MGERRSSRAKVSVSDFKERRFCAASSSLASQRDSHRSSNALSVIRGIFSVNQYRILQLKVAV
jgi:hypothetical protein